MREEFGHKDKETLLTSFQLLEYRRLAVVIGRRCRRRLGLTWAPSTTWPSSIGEARYTMILGHRQEGSSFWERLRKKSDGQRAAVSLGIPFRFRMNDKAEKLLRQWQFHGLTPPPHPKWQSPRSNFVKPLYIKVWFFFRNYSGLHMRG